jgi:hypothetical protein
MTTSKWKKLMMVAFSQIRSQHQMERKIIWGKFIKLIRFVTLLEAPLYPADAQLY